MDPIATKRPRCRPWSDAAVDAPPSDEPIRVVLIEPRAIHGVGVREILEREADIEVLAQVSTAAEAISVVDPTSPDVVLVDADFSQLDATEATRQLHQGAPESVMVIMGRDDDDASIVGAAEVGAVAHVAETAEPAELVATIRRAADGEDLLRDELNGRPTSSSGSSTPCGSPPRSNICRRIRSARASSMCLPLSPAVPGIARSRRPSDQRADGQEPPVVDLPQARCAEPDPRGHVRDPSWLAVLDDARRTDRLSRRATLRP